MKKFKKEKKSFSYILPRATLQPSQRFLIQIQFSSCFHPHPPIPSPLLPHSFAPHFSLFLLPYPLPLLTFSLLS